METLNQLNEAVQRVVEIANSITNDCNKEVWEQAPIIIHQRLCQELVNAVKETPGKVIIENPKANKIMEAIKIIEELYPKLTNGGGNE